MEEEGEMVDLHEGMQVSNEDGDELGTLAALLIPEDEEEAEFFILKAKGGENHLLPFEAVLGVGDGALIVDATAEAVGMYPRVKPDADPSDDECEKAYDVYDETAQYADDEE